MFSIDWAVKKKFQIYNVSTEKLESIVPGREAFDKFFGMLSDNHSFHIEEGGGDTFKLLALRYGHRVFTTSGKKVKDFRDKLGWDKTDENDAVVIGILAKEQPQEFYEYKESDILTLKVTILYREYTKLVKDSTRKKNQLYILKNKLELLASEKEVEKIISRRENTIKALGKEVSVVYMQLSKLLEGHPLWINSLKDIKGVGPVTAAGIIGSVRRFSRFTNRDSLRCFAGMRTKKGNYDYNRQLKQALYNFTEGIIQKRTQPWRQLYDDMKIFYKGKHPDWRPAKVDAYARKFVQTKFLDGMRVEGVKLENLSFSKGMKKEV